MLQEIKDHIEAQPKEVQVQLLKLHHSILDLSDEIEEHYGYKMPGFSTKDEYWCITALLKNI